MGTLYYVSGWLLARLNKTRKGQVLLDSALRQLFVSANSISVVQQVNSAPFAVIDDSRPQISQHQQLTRSGKAWFSFVSLLEALYIVNLTEENAMKHRENLFLEVGKALRKSVSLHDHFADCFPATFSKDDRKKMWRMYFVELLLPYAMMKGGDVLRGIRAMRKPNDTNRL
jgi:putative copper export protein